MHRLRPQSTRRRARTLLATGSVALASLGVTMGATVASASCVGGDPNSICNDNGDYVGHNGPLPSDNNASAPGPDQTTGDVNDTAYGRAVMSIIR
jgi:hypothetical protein